MQARVRCLVLLAGLVALAGCANMHRATVDRELSHPAGSIDALAIETHNGEVDVVTDPTLSEIRVFAKITGAGITPEEAMARAESASVGFETLADGHTARLFVSFDGERRSSEGCDFAVRMPSFAKTTIDTGNGVVRVTGTRGELDIDTSNGSVTLTGHEGDARIETSNGDIVLSGVSGRMRASSSNGEIRLAAGDRGVVEFDLDTSNGGVDVDLGIDFQGSIDAETSNGGVSCERANATASARRSAALVQLGDGARSRIRTSNGSITIR